MQAAFLLGLVAAISAQASAAEYESGPTFKEVQKLLRGLAGEFNGLIGELSDIAAFCASVDENVAVVRDNFLVFFDVRNSQQDDVISLFSGQVKSMRHRADTANAQVRESLSVAVDTSAAVMDQIGNYLNGTKLADVNAAEQGSIDQLTSDIPSDKADFLSDLDQTLDNDLRPLLEAEQNTSIELSNFVQDRKCEYGYAPLAIGNSDVQFKTDFTSVPVVTLLLAGFVSHLDVQRHYNDHSYKTVDVLALDKHVDYVNTTGFGFSMEDISVGCVELKFVFCSWSACQDLHVEAELTRYKKTRGRGVFFFFPG